MALKKKCPLPTGLHTQDIKCIPTLRPPEKVIRLPAIPAFCVGQREDGFPNLTSRLTLKFSSDMKDGDFHSLKDNQSMCFCHFLYNLRPLGRKLLPQKECSTANPVLPAT